MAITDANKEPLKNRLAKAIGHLNSVMRMVDEKRYCIDVLHQLKGVQAALDKTAEVMLKQHLETCVVEAIRNQDTDRVVEELMQVFRKAPELNINLETESHSEVVTAEAVPSGCCH
jgi:DNA-binding FrmR family transcriptional regulator